jgi:hypothetical protein
MRKSSVNNSRAQILRPTSIRKDISIEGLELPVFANSDFPPVHEGMSLSRCCNVFIAVQHASHGSSGLLRSSSYNPGELNRSGFFASETASQSLDLANNFVSSNAADLSDIGLPANKLSTAIDEDEKWTYVSEGFCVQL